MSEHNIIIATFGENETVAMTPHIYQWDYGQILQIEGIPDLPQTFEAHFSNYATGGFAVEVVGINGQVSIPNYFVTMGKTLYVWIYVVSASAGTTEYAITIPVRSRPMPEYYDVSDVGIFDDVVNQVAEYAATATTGAENASASAEAAAASATAAAGSANAAAASASSAAGSAGAAEQARADAVTAKGQAETAAQTATEKAQQSAQNAEQAASNAGRAESAANRAETAETGAKSAKTAAQTAAQDAAASASAASASATSAGQAATSAGQSASAAAGSATTASNAAQTATTKAGEASASATAAAASATAAQTAQTAAETAATNAGQSASTATTKASEAAQSASGAAQSKTDAEAAATRAEQAAASLTVDTALSDSSTNPVENRVITGELADVKSAIDDIEPIVFDTVESTNIYTPSSTQIYPTGTGTVSVGTDKTISIADLPKGVTAWVYNDETVTLPAGTYTLCVDPGLFVYGVNTVALQIKIGSASYTTIATASANQTEFTLAESKTGLLRITYLASQNGYVTTWSGHIWVNKGAAQDYMPVGAVDKTAKEFVNAEQGAENSGKALTVGNNGKVTLASGDMVFREIYEHGNLVDYDNVTPGYIGSNGAVVPYNSLWCTDFMPVQQGKIYCSVGQSQTVYSQYFAFYDADKELVSSYSTLGAMTQFTPTIYYVAVPATAKYFRCTFSSNQATVRTAWVSNLPENPPASNKYNVEDAFPYTYNPDNPCDYAELTVRAFSKVVCIGDSLTYGGFNLANSGTPTGETQSSAELSTRYSYPSNFQRITGIDTTNKGDSGESSVSWYTIHHEEDFSEYDLAIIFLGVNDSSQSVSDADTLTAMQNIVTMLKNARYGMKIAICSCIPAYDGVGYQAKGQLILNWAIGLNDPDIIPLDLATYSHVRPKTSYVAGHCSALGYYQMALDIARYISWYMDQHKRDFRFIQFIGSPDAVWTDD